MAARGVFTLSVFAALLTSGDVLAQPGDATRGYTVRPNYDASRRTAQEVVPMFTVRQPELRQAPVARTVTVRELQHEIPGKALKEWDRAEKAREKGEIDKAMSHLRRAIEFDPEFVAARNNLAALLITRNSPVEAVAQLEESVKLDPNNPMSSANLAVAFMIQRQFDAAERAARRAVDLDRTGTRSRMILGLALVMQDQFTDEALQFLQRAEEEFPQAILLTARIYAARGERAEAETAIRRYLETGDESGVLIAESWLNLLDKAPASAAIASR